MRQQGFVARLAVLSLLVAGCSGSTPSATPGGGAATPTPTSAPSATPEPTMTTLGDLRIGIAAGNPPDTTAHYFWYAEQLGLYEDAGLDEVELVLLANDQLALRALASGDVDVALVGCSALMAALEIGAPMRVVSAVNNKLDYDLIVKSDITRPKELEGRSLGVSAPGAVSFIVPKLLIENDGGDFSKVNVVPVGGSSSRVQALINGTVDGAVLSSGFASRTKGNSNLKSLGVVAESLPNLLFSCHVADESTIAEREPAILAFSRAVVEAGRWAMKDPDAAIAISKTLTPDAPPAEVEATIRTFAEKTYWNTTGVVPPEAWEYTSQQLVDAGDLTGPLAYDAFVLADLATKATDPLGPYTP